MASRDHDRPAEAAAPGVRVAAVCLVVLACVAPLFCSSYHLFQLTLVVVYSIALLGLNLLTGYGGQISLGHGAFYGIGAYTTGILMQHAGMPYWLTIPCAGAVCLVLGFLFGLPAVRLEGLHLALATFALGVVFPQILKTRGIERITGGVQGITLAKIEPPFGLAISPDQWLYCVALATALVLFVAARNLTRSHTGRVIVAIRDRPVAASSVGVDTARYKSLTFGLSAMYTGIAGALGALVVQFVGPDSFGVFLSISLLVGVVVGGLASISGAVYGALFIQFIPNVADDVSKAAPSAIYGVVLVLSVYLMPRGVAGLVRRLTGALVARLNARASGHHAAPVSPATPVTQTKEGS
ncbi:MAG TPA: branched-chain amino acid ABC transporter permease [Polyangiaceae bacterium]|jgi:branched-chain amino acid transport system permease protein|nr:branched-chain amino acid ABC transporter permease [Polyangiaceae bacterium]